MTNPANTLGLDYAALAAKLPHRGPLIDCHTHVGTLPAAELFFDVAERFNVERVFTMTGLESARLLHPRFGQKLRFICVPDYLKRQAIGTFTTQWLDDIRAFRAELGSGVIKFWNAPRRKDLAADSPDPRIHEALDLDSPIRQQGMKLAYDLGYRVFMTHVGDPDTWFKTVYTDTQKYGTKAAQYPPLEAALEKYRDVTWIGAHLGGWPEDLNWLQAFLDRHPNYVVDTSAAKWQMRELSKQPQRFREFCLANPGRVLFGTDIVANEAMDQCDFDLFASRYWGLRTLLETDYDGPSPIVDPDLHRVDPSLPEASTPPLRGANLPAAALQSIYHDAAAKVLAGL